MKIFEFTGKAQGIPRQIKESKAIKSFHDDYWLGIHQRITIDRERLLQANQEPDVIVVGINEYKTLINIFSRREGNFTLPTEYCKIPIVLAPVLTVCAAVPKPDRFWFEFIDE